MWLVSVSFKLFWTDQFMLINSINRKVQEMMLQTLFPKFPIIRVIFLGK